MVSSQSKGGSVVSSRVSDGGPSHGGMGMSLRGGVSQMGQSKGGSVVSSHSHGSRQSNMSQSGMSQSNMSQGGVSQSRVTLPTFVTHLGVNHDCPKCDKVRTALTVSPTSLRSIPLH